MPFVLFDKTKEEGSSKIAVSMNCITGLERDRDPDIVRVIVKDVVTSGLVYHRGKFEDLVVRLGFYPLDIDTNDGI